MAASANQPMSSATPIEPSPPQQLCDLIMKGGITSGVVYPLAIVELARHYRFKNIGGTSAGAIAAAGLAAAEYRRLTAKSADGFVKLTDLPGELGKQIDGTSMLAGLLQPQRTTRPLFNVFLAAIKQRGARRKIAAIAAALLRNFPLAAFAGAAIPAGIGALLLVTTNVSLPLLITAVFFQIALVLIGASIGVGLAVTLRTLTAVPRNLFGLCTGREEAGGRAPALTNWLEAFIDDVAFGGPVSAPLTFGALKAAGYGPDLGINLQMVTTNLALSRPETLPRSTHGLWFRQSEIEQLFSPRIVQHLVGKARTPKDKQREKIARSAGLLPLPLEDDIPVVVGARMSLSFPILLSAVPLYAFDSSFQKPQLTRCWYSDGGITSNLPIHFFDQIIPRWPTFAFNLTGFHPEHPYDPKDESKNIWLPSTNLAGQQPRMAWPDEDKEGRKRLAHFFGAIQETMHSWRDNIQVTAPGFRDRIAHIKLQPNEGGLNLTMQASVIKALGLRGEFAAAELVRRYSDKPLPGTQLTWDNHRWIRLRTALRLLHEKLLRFGATYAASQGARSYEDLAKAPPSYPIQPGTIEGLVADLNDLLQSWGSNYMMTHGDIPDPQPDLRIVPRF
jgi:predicted acylesterase/phospholipase RssA